VHEYIRTCRRVSNTPRFDGVATMRVLSNRPDDLTEAELATFEYEDLQGLEPRAGNGTADHNLEALPDRRAFEEEAARHVAFAKRHGHPLCLALIAFDRTDGEADEDEKQFLNEATACWRNVLRAEDLVGRWRSREFAIVLANCTTASAVQLCWRLREETPAGKSFSAALVSMHATEPFDELLGRAEDSLDQAKAKGRDRTVAEGLVDLD
jgi:diguanylate cyclase (GGDEF)-like protein